METEPRSTCWTCWRPEEACLCRRIRPFETRTHFVLLMHPKEARLRHLGTGRLTRACIPRTSIVVGREFGNDPKVQAWIDDPTHQTFLLYPGGPTLAGLCRSPGGNESPAAGHPPAATHSPAASHPPASTHSPAPVRSDKPFRLFLLDATWTQAKGLLWRSPNVLGLPKLSIEPEAPSRFNRIKQQPARLCLSTIESVHQWIDEANEVGIESTGTDHHVLIEVLDELCRYQLACASDPNRPGYRRKPYKSEEERRPARWWGTGKVLVE